MLRIRRQWLERAFLGLVLGALAASGPGPCSLATEAPSEPPPPVAEPILIVAVDGLEWDIVLPMIRKGRLPNLEALMSRGRYGELATFRPTWSPVVWTSVATGKVPAGHGIPNFYKHGSDGELVLYNSTDRTTKALWNILSDHGRSVHSIGWWMTYPVEKILGVMVAQTNTRAQLDTAKGKHVWKGTLLEGVAGQVWPTDRQNEMIAELQRADGDLPGLTRRVFGQFESPLSLFDERIWGNCQWAFRADATYFRIALKLARGSDRPDLTLLYVGGPDVVGHRFWRFMDPGQFRHAPTPGQIANFGSVIEDYYAYLDGMLGELLELHGSDATVLVVSDHGMAAENLEAEFDPDNPPANVSSGGHENAPPGVFIAAGPFVETTPGVKTPREIERDDLRVIGTVLDITPTVLAMLRIPVGADMDGRVMTSIFANEFRVGHQPRAVPTHDDEEFFANRSKDPVLHPGDAERLEQLRALGYIGGGSED